MPTVTEQNGSRIYFFSNEPEKSPHVRVEREDCTALIFLDPVRVVESNGYDLDSLSSLESFIIQNHDELLGKWNGYFGISSG